MNVGDIVKVESFGPSSSAEDCYAWVHDVDSHTDACLVIIRGRYMVTSNWCEVGHTFFLPHSGPRNGHSWGVLDPDDVPDDIYVELAKQRLIRSD